MAADFTMSCHSVSNKHIPILKRICDINIINETFGSVIDGHTRHNNRITSAQNSHRSKDNGAKHLEKKTYQSITSSCSNGHESKLKALNVLNGSVCFLTANRFPQLSFPQQPQQSLFFKPKKTRAGKII